MTTQMLSCFKCASTQPRLSSHTDRQDLQVCPPQSVCCSYTHTLGVAASRNLGGSVGWQDRIVKVPNFLQWTFTSVCPTTPGLEAVNTKS